MHEGANNRVLHWWFVTELEDGYPSALLQVPCVRGSIGGTSFKEKKILFHQFVGANACQSPDRNLLVKILHSTFMSGFCIVRLGHLSNNIYK